MKDKTVLYFSLVFFLIQMGVAIIVFYLPTQIAELLGTKVGITVGLFVAVPWGCALIAVFFLPRYAGKRNQLRACGGISLVVSAIGLAGSLAPSAGIAMAALCLAVAGIWAARPRIAAPSWSCRVEPAGATCSGTLLASGRSPAGCSRAT